MFRGKVTEPIFLASVADNPDAALLYGALSERKPLDIEPGKVKKSTRLGENFLYLLARSLKLHSFFWWLQQFAARKVLTLDGQVVTKAHVAGWEAAPRQHMPFQCLRIDESIHGQKIDYEGVSIRVEVMCHKGYKWVQLRLVPSQREVLRQAIEKKCTNNKVEQENLGKYLDLCSKMQCTMPLARVAMELCFGIGHFKDLRRQLLPPSVAYEQKKTTDRAQGIICTHYACPHAGRADGLCANFRHIMYGNNRTNQFDRLCHLYSVGVVAVRRYLINEKYFDLNPGPDDLVIKKV